LADQEADQAKKADQADQLPADQGNQEADQGNQPKEDTSYHAIYYVNSEGVAGVLPGEEKEEGPTVQAVEKSKKNNKAGFDFSNLRSSGSSSEEPSSLREETKVKKESGKNVHNFSTVGSPSNLMISQSGGCSSLLKGDFANIMPAANEEKPSNKPAFEALPFGLPPGVADSLAKIRAGLEEVDRVGRDKYQPTRPTGPTRPDPFGAGSKNFSDQARSGPSAMGSESQEGGPLTLPFVWDEKRPVKKGAGAGRFGSVVAWGQSVLSYFKKDKE
jgi:hypothetical protein